MLEINREEFVTINSEEEFYFLLAQFVMYIFYRLGSLNSFKKEINYLTNPVIERSIEDLAKRNLKFIKNYTTLISNDISIMNTLYHSLVSSSHKYFNVQNSDRCSDWYYKGLYSENMLLEWFRIYQLCEE